MTNPFPENPIIKLLENAGFQSGWAILGDTLILWEHDQDPPEPLIRPQATDETPSPA
jgi:hypothetical protein